MINTQQIIHAILYLSISIIGGFICVVLGYLLAVKLGKKGDKIMVGILGIGASLGACVRYFLTNFGKKHFGIHFPFATLIFKCYRSLITGNFDWIKVKFCNNNSFMELGFLGGYTTFSTFNTELFTLLDDKDYRGSIYIFCY